MTERHLCSLQKKKNCHVLWFGFYAWLRQKLLKQLGLLFKQLHTYFLQVSRYWFCSFLFSRRFGGRRKNQTGMRKAQLGDAQQVEPFPFNSSFLRSETITQSPSVDHSHSLTWSP